ncbi:MAG: exodeoxyribonuclease III [Bdellovibrionales bacterium]|nr:exodeoxyribonuclease III [Bdellovibrionales bacterium]
MKIISWNVNGIRACAKRGFLEFIKREDPDILCIQETKAHPDQLDEELLHPLGRVGYFSSAERKGYSGTATFLKQQPDDVYHGIRIKKFDSEGRFVVTEQKDFTLYNVYFPNGAAREERHLYKMEFLDKFTKHLKKKIDNNEKVIVVGDYNVAYLDYDVFDPVRLSKCSGFLPEERECFKSYLDIGFIDTFRYFYPKEEQIYTWWSYRENARIANRGWRIDHICVTENLIGKVKDTKILDQQLGSDHCPVVMEIDL